MRSILDAFSRLSTRGLASKVMSQGGTSARTAGGTMMTAGGGTMATAGMHGCSFPPKIKVSGVGRFSAWLDCKEPSRGILRLGKMVGELCIISTGTAQGV